MRVIIAGSRAFSEIDIDSVQQAIDDSGFAVTEVICGCARGADSAGRNWAYANNIPVNEMPAAWGVHGKSAGYKRNREMGLIADAAIVLWDGQSKGSKHMINIMSELDKPCYVHRF